MEIRKRKGSAMVAIMIFICILIAISSIGVEYLPGSIQSSVDDGYLKTRAIMIDRVLSEWYNFYSEVYPDDLNQEMLKNYGLTNDDVITYHYKVDATKKKYQLSVQLKNGAIWLSPGSKEVP